MADDNAPDIAYEDDAEVEAGGDEVDANVGPVVDTASADPLHVLFRDHPECRIYYAEAVTPKLALLAVPPDHSTRLGAPDENHRSSPWLTQFERTKIIGFRSNQLAQGAKPYLDIKKNYPHFINTGEIARLELKEKKLPFIIARMMPDGKFEFWRLSDLLIL
jgi:DNA-directed RNA polymerase subunit K/omega